MTARESPQPPLRSGARKAINPYREDARRHGRAAVPWVREDRVSHISRQHKTVKHWIMMSHRGAPPQEPLYWQWGETGGAAGAARVA
jgi:hypothetical protein